MQHLNRVGFVLFLLSALTSQTIFSQALECEDAVVLCSLDDLIAFTSTMPDNNVTDPNPLCPGAPGFDGTPHNLSWFAFIAGSTDVTITINAFNCNGTMPGIQYGVYTDCSFDEWVVCDPGCNDANFDIEMTDLTIGDDYFIFLDGCAGSICDYEVEAVIGGQFMELDEPSGVICTDNCTEIATDVYEVCVGAENVDFEVDGFDLTVEYTWTMTNDGTGAQVSQDVVDGDNDISYDFLDEGIFTLCSQAYNGCDYTEVYCVTIEVVPYPDELFEPLEICANILEEGVIPDTPLDPNGDGTIGWQGPDITAPGDPVMFTAETSIGCEYLQEVTVIELPLPPINFIDTAICIPGGSVSIGGYTFNADGNDEFVALTAAANGCDSVINLTVYEIEYELDIIIGECTPNGIEMTLVIDAEESGTDMEMNSWAWILNNEVVEGSENELTIYADPSFIGTYTVDFVREMLGVSCPSTSLPVTINPENYAPLILPDSYDNPVCIGEEGVSTYILDIEDYPYPEDLVFTWVVTGGDILDGQGTEAISVDFGMSTTAEVCYSVANSCGKICDICETIVFTENPVPEIMPVDTVCVGEELTLIATPILPEGTINWDFDLGANIISIASPAEFTIYYDTIGVKQVTVIADYGCETPVSTSIEVVVIEDPEITGLACLGSGGNLAIDWDDLPGFDDYMINVTMGTGGMLDGSQYIFEDLEAGDEVAIEITVEGDCGLIVADTSCIVPSCDVVELSLGQDIPDTLCLDGSFSAGSFLGAEITGAIGNGTYGGPGVDATTGTFDPNVAGPGTHTITYTFSYQQGLCAAQIDTSITLVEEANYELLKSVDTLCVGDIMSLQIAGYYGGTAPAIVADGDMEIISNADPENYELSWNSPGLKSINTNVNIPGCGDYPVSTQILVEDLTPLQISCDETNASISITWNDEIEYDEYEILINNMVVDTVSAGSFLQEDLDDGQEINIEIVPVSNNSCIAESYSINCSTIICPQVPIDVMIPGDSTSICVLGASFDPIDLGANYDASLLDFEEDVNWTVMPGAIDQNGVFDPNAGPGDYLVTFGIRKENCEYSIDIPFYFELVPALDLMGDKMVMCIDDNLQLSYTGDDLTGYTFNWDGLPASGDPNILDNQNLNFDTPGLYTIGLEASSSICPADRAEFLIEVVDSTRTPIVQCNPGVDIIELNWTVDDSDCNGLFSVYIDGNLVSVQDSMRYNVTDLDPESTVSIEIINENEDCICPEKITILDCTTLACPNTNIEINVPDTTICATDNFDLIELEILYDETLFSDFASANWIGQAIDPLSGVFDPNMVGPGDYTLDVEFSDGPCVFTASTIISVEQIPTLALSGPDTICIEDDWQIAYIGDDLAGYDYTFMSDDGPMSNLDIESLLIPFDQAGLFTLTMAANSEACEAEEISLSVMVLDSVSTPQVSCISYVDSIVVTWTVADSDCNGSYTVDSDLFTNPIETTENTITIEAAPDSDLAISITNNSSCLCASKTVNIECSTSPCPDYNLAITGVDEVYCLEALTSGINLIATLNGAVISQNIMWSGDGIDNNGFLQVDDSFVEGIYTYEVSYSENLCEYSAQVDIEIVLPEDPVYNVTQPECPGDLLGELRILGNTSDPDNAYYLDGQLIDPSQIYNVDVGASELTIIRKGVCERSEIFAINSAPSIDLEIEGIDLLPHGESSSFSVDISDPDIVNEIRWEFADTVAFGNPVGIQIESYTELCVYVLFNDICEEVLCRDLSLEPNRIFFPNVFTPGSGDDNGNFTIGTNGFVERVNYFKVYDRWGNMVHSQENVEPNDGDISWDGTLNGDELIQGVYVYIIEVLMINGRTDRFYGDVTLLR